MNTTMQRIDRVVREQHEAREGHPCDGYWTERTEQSGTMQPRRFVTTCCDNR